jgi:vacuolar-type H+-ATPase subunit E/Vma4
LALDQLITALEEDAEKQAHTELEQARSEAHRIATHARDLIVRRRAEFLVRMENDLREETEIELVEARRRSRSIVLGARQRLLDRVFTAAEARLPSLLETNPPPSPARPSFRAPSRLWSPGGPALPYCPMIRSAVASRSYRPMAT